MKKIFSILLLFLFSFTGAFAQFRVSAGGGGFIGGDHGGGINIIPDMEPLYPVMGFDSALKFPYFGGGGFIFFDAVYAEASAAFFAGNGSQEFIFTMDDELISFKRKYAYTSINLSLLGKYPFKLNEKLFIFPLLGIDYQIMLNIKDVNGVKYKGFAMPDLLRQTLGSMGYYENDIVFPGKPADFNSLWFKFGGGADFMINSNVFIRFSALYGIRLKNKMEKNMEKQINLLSVISGYDIRNETRLGHGLNVKIAAGYKF